MGFWAREDDDGGRAERRPLAVEADRLVPPNRRSRLSLPLEMREREGGRERKGE